LAYHSLRAKDKAFEAKLTLHLDPNLGSVPAVPQDLSRVLLNVFTNAFYAVQQKARSASTAYHPEVQVRTQREAGQVKIRIRDNGTGVPESIRGKIFQPFFTTKPTGEGTGLGLSLSYDIITKGHGGTFALDSEEGEFTELTLTLPAGAPLDNCYVKGVVEIVGGLTIESCTFESYLDFQAGGHNLAGYPIKILNNIFLNFVNFFDCWYTGEAITFGCFGAGGVEAPEAVEEQRHVVGGDAGAVVFDAQFVAAAGARAT
nr:two component histidine kinase, putative [Tanacetum cinerariifolium]